MVGDDSAEGSNHNDRRGGLKSEGCRYKRAEPIGGAGGDYLFSLKGNRGTLLEDVEEYCKEVDFEKPEAGTQAYTSFEGDHGGLSGGNRR